MKNIITTSIMAIAVMHTCNAIATSRSECQGEVATQYTEIVNTYKSTGKCTFSGGRLQALHDRVCECVTSGKTSAFACAAAQEICCGANIDYVVTGTNNHVQTVTKHTWNSATSVCSTSTIYRCETGYYGNPPSASYGCNRCPLWEDAFTEPGLRGTRYGTTDGPGATDASECYIPTGTYFDSTGTFKLTNNCNY